MKDDSEGSTKAGTKVLFNYGSDVVRGTVQELFDSKGVRWARVRVAASSFVMSIEASKLVKRPS